MRPSMSTVSNHLAAADITGSNYVTAGALTSMRPPLSIIGSNHFAAADITCCNCVAAEDMNSLQQTNSPLAASASAAGFARRLFVPPVIEPAAAAAWRPTAEPFSWRYRTRCGPPCMPPSSSSCWSGEYAGTAPDECVAAPGTGLSCCGVPALGALTARLTPVAAGSIS